MTRISLSEELRQAARLWREWAGEDALAKSVTAVHNQSAFRGRNDDGNEAGATWIANENTNWTQATDTNFRFRVQVEETAGASGTNPAVGNYNNDSSQFLLLQYNKNAAGWNTVAFDGTGSVVKLVTSSQFAGPVGISTKRLTTSAKTLAANGSPPASALVEVGGLGSASLISNQCIENEFVLQIVDADVSDGDTIQLRATKWNFPTILALDSYTNTPSITVSKTAGAAGYLPPSRIMSQAVKRAAYW